MKSHSEILRTGTSKYSTYTFLRDTFSPKQQEIHMRWEVLWHLQKCIMLLYVQWSNKKHVIFGSGFHLVFRIWLGFRAKENCANSNFTKDLSTETWFNPLCFSHCPVKHQCSPNTHLRLWGHIFQLTKFDFVRSPYLILPLFQVSMIFKLLNMPMKERLLAVQAGL